MTKKLLILGMSFNQYDLAEKAKEMGLEVHAIAGKIGGPVLELADKYAQVDILDKDAVKKYAVDNDIDFIYTMGLEIAIPVITAVSEDLGLNNFVSSESIKKLSNKYVWRKAIEGVEGNVKAFCGKTKEDFKDWDSYPAVIKPVDGSGQRGVHKVDSYQDILDVFDESMSFSRSKQLIIEDFIDGPEVSVNSYMYKGELAFYIVSDRISYDEYPGGIIKEHYIPSRIVDKEMDEKIRDMVEEVNKRMGFEDGHVYFQLKIQDGKPWIIEFTPRYDGCHMWKLIKEACDLDLRQVSLEWLIDKRSESLENYHFHLNEGQFMTRFISDKPGTIVNRKNYDLPDNLLHLQWYYEDGDKVKTVTGYLEKVGYTISKH